MSPNQPQHDHQEQSPAAGLLSQTSAPSSSSAGRSSSSTPLPDTAASGMAISATTPEDSVPFSQYDISLPPNKNSSRPGAGAAAEGDLADAASSGASSPRSARFRSLKSALQSLIHGHVLTREDMPPSAAPASSGDPATAGDVPALSIGSSAQAAAKTAVPGVETFLSTTRIFNSAAPVAAHLVALPQTTQDVVAILKFCTAHSLSPSIKSGGYATAGWSVQGDVVIDLSRMNSIDIVRPQDFYADKKKKRQTHAARGAEAGNRQRNMASSSRSTSAVGTARTRKADEAFASVKTAADFSGSSNPPLGTTFLDQEGRKRLSPPIASATLTTSPLPSPAIQRVVSAMPTGQSVTSSASGMGSGRSGSRSTSETSRDGATSGSQTDATSENISFGSTSDLLAAKRDVADLPSAPPGASGRAQLASAASDPSTSASSVVSTVSNSRRDSSTGIGSRSSGTSTSASQLRTGLAEHLSWQRHHRPDGRASTHERVFVPESGPFVWRADGNTSGDAALGTDGLGSSSNHSNLSSPSNEFASTSRSGPLSQQHQPRLSPTYPLTGPPSALHAARVPSALLPTHSHEQPWQEARFRQQIEESAMHHRQTVMGGVPSQTAGMVFSVGSSGHPFDYKTSSGIPNLVFPGSGLAAATAPSSSGGNIVLPPPIPSGLASFLPPFNLSPDSMEQHLLAQQQHQHQQHYHHPYSYSQHQQRHSPAASSPVAPRPGIYTRPYLLAVFGPGVGVRALDLATDEAGRTNTWDRGGCAGSDGRDADGDVTLRAVPSDAAADAGENGAASASGFAMSSGDDDNDDNYEPVVDWEEPLRSTPYHCPLSAYPVGSTAMTTGGFGYISRAYGLSLDNVVEVELVLADGRVLVLNEGSKHRSKEEADLWWAVRGAAPCFGVVTRIVAKAYPIPSCFSGNLIFPFNPATAPSLIKHWRDCLKGVLPREMYTNLILVAGPNPSAHVIMIQICLLQSASEGETFVQAISSWTGERMLLKDVEERPFLAQQDGVAQVLKGGGGRRWMIRGDTLETLTDELIGQSVLRFKNATANRGVWLFELVNGAIADNAVEEEEDEEENASAPGGRKAGVVDGSGDVQMSQPDTAASTPSRSTAGRFTIPPTLSARVSPANTDTQRVTKETCLAPSLRRAHFMVGALQQWDDYDEDRACVVSVDHWLRDAVSPVSIGGPLPSFLERSETRERIASTFGEANLERLIRLKRAVDPRGLFRHTFAAGLSRFASVVGGGGGSGGGEAESGGAEIASGAARADGKLARIP